MMRMMEQLESRVLFIASEGVILADLSAIEAQGVLAKSDLKSALATATADVKGIKTAVADASPTTADKQALVSLEKAVAAGETTYKLRVTNILNSGKNDGVTLLAKLKNLKAHPNSAVIQAKVQAAFNALQGVFSNTVLTNVETNAANTVNTIDTAANALVTAVPSTLSDVGVLEGNLAGDLTTLSTQGTAIQSAIAQLGIDLS